MTFKTGKIFEDGKLKSTLVVDKDCQHGSWLPFQVWGMLQHKEELRPLFPQWERTMFSFREEDFPKVFELFLECEKIAEE
jgi:hypothetical protein